MDVGRDVSGESRGARRSSSSRRGGEATGQRSGRDETVVTEERSLEEQGRGGRGGWGTGRGLGRGPGLQVRARDRTLGIEPSGLNPRAQTLGIEPSESNRTRARVCHGTRRGVGSRESYRGRYVSNCLIV